MKAVGKFRFIKDRSDAGYRTGNHDDFEASTIDATRHRYEGQKMDGTLYSVDPEVWALELYPTTGKEDSSLVWDGEGLPPVGCECEYETKFDGWQPVRIELIKSEGIAFTWLANSQAYNGLDCVGVQKSGHFRPIRSEADKKKCDTIEKMLAIFFGVPPVDEPNENDRFAMSELYDAIKSGKIVIE